MGRRAEEQTRTTVREVSGPSEPTYYPSFAQTTNHQLQLAMAYSGAGKKGMAGTVPNDPSAGIQSFRARKTTLGLGAYTKTHFPIEKLRPSHREKSRPGELLTRMMVQSQIQARNVGQSGRRDANPVARRRSYALAARRG